MGSNYINKMSYDVDLVFCIDATMSMGPTLDMVKKNALNFYQDFENEMNAKSKKIGNLRIRVVAFRDYFYDGNKAMMVTNFFNLPAQAQDFEACVNSIYPLGGGDDPEDGLEALAFAMKSAWSTGAVKKRHVIVVWSDDGTHALGFGKKGSLYPKGMAQDFDELTEWWGCKRNPGLMDESAKRLLIFAPEKDYWTTIRDNWNNVIHVETEAGTGLQDCEYREILDVICNSI